MRNFQENRLSMYLAVLLVLDEYSSVWSSLPAFSDAVTELGDVVQNIQNNHQIQETDTKGITKNKGQSEAALIEQTLLIAGAVIAYATNISDHELLEKVNFSKSELTHKRDSLLMDVCQLVHDEAAGVIGSLGPYGIANNDLNELQTRINDYESRVGAPRAAISGKSTATSGLVPLFKMGDLVLEQKLDMLMANFKTSNPEFYHTYFNARKVVHNRGRGSAQAADEAEPDEPTSPEPQQPI